MAPCISLSLIYNLAFLIMIRNENGFSLAQVIVAAGLLGGLSLVFMQLMKNMGQAQNFAQSKSDEIELKSSIRMILDDERFCRVSLAGNGVSGSPSSPVIFEKQNIDEDNEGLDIALYLSNQAGDARTLKKFNGENNPDANDKSKFGKLTIKTLKLIMNNGIGSNYSDSVGHSDVGILRAIVEKKVSNTQNREITIDFDINVGMSTGQSPENSGETRILSCSKVQSISNQLECYTLRRYEKIDYRNFFLDSNGNGSSSQNGLNYSDVVTLHGGCCTGSSGISIPNSGLDNDPLSTAIGNPNDWYGIKCNSANGFFMLSCGHASTEDASDNDFIMTSDGCFSGDNDGSRMKNVLDIRCCRYE
jgi:hypothetical protein